MLESEQKKNYTHIFSPIIFKNYYSRRSFPGFRERDLNGGPPTTENLKRQLRQ